MICPLFAVVAARRRRKEAEESIMLSGAAGRELTGWQGGVKGGYKVTCTAGFPE